MDIFDNHLIIIKQKSDKINWNKIIKFKWLEFFYLFIFNNYKTKEW